MSPENTGPKFHRGRSGIFLGGLVAAMIAPSSCWASAAPEQPLPSAPPVVVVTMTEYRYDYDPVIPAGRVVFQFVNEGSEDHRPSLLPLPEDMPPIDEQLRGSERRAAVPFAGVATRDPGETGTFAVDLAAGQRYALICFAVAPDGESHALKGMASEFTAR